MTFWSRFAGSSLVWGIAIAFVCVASSAEAQERPSLAALQAANCAKVDIDGDSYRPFYCDAQCGCLLSNGPGSVCTEVAPGDFDVAWSVFEQCLTAPVACVFDAQSGANYCLNDLPVIELGSACTTSADCTPPFFCPLPGSPISGICINPISPGTACTTTSDCTTVEVCDDANRTVCVVDSDCVGPETCQYDGLCGRACTSQAECEQPGSPFSLSITGVGAPESTTAVNCSGGPVNHKDARACLVQVGCDLCGDGILDIGETCDDGNTTPGDGCAADCTTE